MVYPTERQEEQAAAVVMEVVNLVSIVMGMALVLVIASTGVVASVSADANVDEPASVGTYCNLFRDEITFGRQT